MPTKTLAEQTGNSCAAHCAVIAIAELLSDPGMTKSFAEGTLWPAIQFKANGDQAIDGLAAQKNSDPRLMVSEIASRWSTVKAALICDETQKTTAMTYVDQSIQPALQGLFNMLKRAGSVASISIDDGIYYNCSYLMKKGGDATTATYEGMHNILVTKQGGQTYYYNPNESVPVWKVVVDWKKLENQNGGTYSYVFTGVCVEMKK